MCETPRDFPKLGVYWDQLARGWSIDAATREALLVDDFAEFYSRLSGAAFPGFSGRFFDKTPKYMECLGKCLSRTEFVRKAVVVFRDPRGVFASQARRLSPDLPLTAAVERNFEVLRSRYLRYFIGSAAHFWNSSVLFVPFEDLVTREAIWLSIMGNFARGHAFSERRTSSRFVNVEPGGMRSNKVSEAMTELPSELQERILDATELAAPFHADPASRSQRIALWNGKVSEISAVLDRYDLPRFGVRVDGTYFEPMTYLLRYADVLKSGMNPVDHFTRFGRREKRQPA